MALPWPIAYKIWLIDSCLYSGCVIWIRGLHFGCFFWMLEFYFNWCSLQKMLMLIRKSDSSTFCLSTADQFHSLSWGQPGLEMNLTGHDPTLRSNAGWHLWHKSTRPSYLHTIQTPPYKVFSFMRIFRGAKRERTECSLGWAISVNQCMCKVKLTIFNA